MKKTKHNIKMVGVDIRGEFAPAPHHADTLKLVQTMASMQKCLFKTRGKPALIVC